MIENKKIMPDDKRDPDHEIIDQIETEPTEHPEVNQAVTILSEGLLEINRDQIVGIYLSGSLALGDFRPDKSDLDFVVVTKAQLDKETLTKIQDLHQRMRANKLPYADNTECDYIPFEAIKRYDPLNSTYPHLGTDGHFAVESHESNEIINLYILREHGIVIFGPPPKALIDKVSADDIRKSARLFLQGWWEPILKSEIVKTSEYQAYTILSMCRLLYNLRFGTVVSKTDAAQWATAEYGERFSDCIQSALNWGEGEEIECSEKAKEMIALALSYKSQ